MKTYTFRAIIEPDEGGYHGYVPALRGCHTCGDTIEETKENLKDAIEAFVASIIDDGLVVPQEEILEFYPSIEVPAPSRVKERVYA